MKRHYVLIAVSLLASLFIYLFYRTEKTVINELFLALVSTESFAELRGKVNRTVHLNGHIIYSLPEGLWVFCITLTSKFLFIKIGRREIDLLFAPLLFSVGLELFQLLHLTNGRFDLWDIGISISFWMIAGYLINQTGTRQDIFRPFNLRSLICISTYLIVYLAHVWD